MRACAAYLHQVHGTLRMVELYGAAMVAEEMEQLALSLLDSSATERDEAFTVLMRGIVQLPDYLERLQSGLKDIRSEEHTSELQSLMRISYAVFCLKKKTTKTTKQRAQ